jgi:glycosyltransferase involved in cell wall biosynthesis
VASDRLRIAVPAGGLRAHGVESHYCALSEAALPDPGAYAAVVFGKLVPAGHEGAARAELWLRFVARARASGCRIVADVSDNPFLGEGPRAEYYRRLLAAADVVTVPSAAMQAEIAEAGSPARIVNDPYEGVPGQVRFSPAAPARLLWFGHRANFPYLHAILPALSASAATRALELELEVVSSELEGFDAYAAGWSERSAGRLRLSYEEWSPAALARALAGCDLVVVPSDPRDPRKRGASANRVTETLIAGRLPVASPLEAYLPFADAALITDDVAAGVAEALSQPARMAARIAAGQRRVEAAFSPAAVAAQWRAVLG